MLRSKFSILWGSEPMYYLLTDGNWIFCGLKPNELSMVNVMRFMGKRLVSLPRQFEILMHDEELAAIKKQELSWSCLHDTPIVSNNNKVCVILISFSIIITLSSIFHLWTSTCFYPESIFKSLYISLVAPRNLLMYIWNYTVNKLYNIML